MPIEDRSRSGALVVPSRYLPDMKWNEVKAYLDAGHHTIIVSLGSTENHGPHAPLGTDTMITEELCRRLAPKLDALIAPMLPLGFAPQHLSFPGSISIGHETLAHVLLEVAHCLADQGFQKFLFLSGHGGNRLALELATSNLKQSRPQLGVHHVRLLPIQTSGAMRRRVESKYGQSLSKVWEAHGGEQETSAVMALQPSLVDLGAAALEPDVTTYLDRGRDPEISVIDYNLREHAPSGNWGDPRNATAAQGDIFFDEMVEHIATRLRALESVDSQEA